MSNFVYLTKELEISDTFSIKEMEIGILLKEEAGVSYIQFVNYDKDIAVSNEYVKSFNPKETGDEFEYKVCNRCNRLLPVDNFSKNQNGKNNRSVRRPSCNECRIYIDGASVPSALKKQWDKTKPKMVIWECPICKKKTIPGLTSKVVLDHDHNTGKPRAWICDSCNTGLGRFKDDIDTIKDAIKYLRKNKGE